MVNTSLVATSLQGANTPFTYDHKPLFVLDVGEHAYYFDYRNSRLTYAAAVLRQLGLRRAKPQGKRCPTVRPVTLTFLLSPAAFDSQILRLGWRRRHARPGPGAATGRIRCRCHMPHGRERMISPSIGLRIGGGGRMRTRREATAPEAAPLIDLIDEAMTHR